MAEEGMKLTKLGYPVKTLSDRCISKVDDFYYKVLSYGKGRETIADGADSDESCVLSNVLAAHALQYSDPQKSKTYLSKARENVALATVYEQAVFAAVSYSMMIDKDYDVAIDRYRELLQDWPRDLASLKRAQLLCVQSGQPDRSLDLVNQVKEANQDASYFNGICAFALLEVGQLEDAETAARAALEINNKDFLAQHCVGYVLKKKCQFGEAVSFLKDFSPAWESCSSYMYTHNWCLVAACYLEGGAYDCFYEIYKKHIIEKFKELGKEGIEKAQVYANILLLLTRYRLCREMLLVDKCEYMQQHFSELVISLRSKDTWYVERQLDLLSIRALTSVKEMKRAHELSNGLMQRVRRVLHKKPDLDLERQGIKLTNAMISKGKCKDDTIVSYLGSDFKAKNFKEMIGATDEHLQVFNEIWYCALVNSDQQSKVKWRVAISAIEKALKEREVPFLWRLLGIIYEMLADEVENPDEITDAKLLEKDAFEKAESLEKSYFK